MGILQAAPTRCRKCFTRLGRLHDREQPVADLGWKPTLEVSTEVLSASGKASGYLRALIWTFTAVRPQVIAIPLYIVSLQEVCAWVPL